MRLNHGELDHSEPDIKLGFSLRTQVGKKSVDAFITGFRARLQDARRAPEAPPHIYPAIAAAAPAPAPVPGPAPGGTP